MTAMACGSVHRFQDDRRVRIGLKGALLLDDSTIAVVHP